MRTLLRFTCGFLLSALCAIFLCSGLHLYLAAAVLLVLSILLCILRPRIGVALLGFSLGLFWTAGYQAIYCSLTSSGRKRQDHLRRGHRLQYRNGVWTPCSGGHPSR